MGEDAEELLAEGVFSTAQACAFLGIGKTTLYRLMNEGKIPFVEAEGIRRRMVPKVGAKRYLKKGLDVGRQA